MRHERQLSTIFIEALYIMKITEENKEKIIKLFQMKTYTKKEISQECQCSVDTVNRVLEKAGLKNIQLSKKLQDISNSVIEDFNSSMYCKDLAKKYCVDEHSIYKILDKAGIKRQSGYHSNCILNYFENIDTPHKAYLLGFITADGAIVNDVLSIEVHKNDIDVLEFARKEINPLATLTPTRDCFKVTFGAKQLAYDLKKYGIIQNKSKFLSKVPVELIPQDLLCYYFRGLIDGDGCVHKDGKISIYSGSYNFIEDVQKVLIKELELTKLKIYQGTTFFITWSSKEDKQKLFNYLYKDLNATFFYKRKYDRLLLNL